MFTNVYHPQIEAYVFAVYTIELDKYSIGITD